MRFYFQDKAAGNFATKCIRVSSTATTQDVIETLAEKFRPDMRMLSSPKYSLYEVHVSGGPCVPACVDSSQNTHLSRGQCSDSTALPRVLLFLEGLGGTWQAGRAFAGLVSVLVRSQHTRCGKLEWIMSVLHSLVSSAIRWWHFFVKISQQT